MNTVTALFDVQHTVSGEWRGPFCDPCGQTYLSRIAEDYGRSIHEYEFIDACETGGRCRMCGGRLLTRVQVQWWDARDARYIVLQWTPDGTNLGIPFAERLRFEVDVETLLHGAPTWNGIDCPNDPFTRLYRFDGNGFPTIIAATYAA